MKNEGDIRLSIRQARKLYVLEELICGRMTNKEAGLRNPFSHIRGIRRLRSRARM